MYVIYCITVQTNVEFSAELQYFIENVSNLSEYTYVLLVCASRLSTSEGAFPSELDFVGQLLYFKSLQMLASGMLSGQGPGIMNTDFLESAWFHLGKKKSFRPLDSWPCVCLSHNKQPLQIK